MRSALRAVIFLGVLGFIAWGFLFPRSHGWMFRRKPVRCGAGQERYR